MSANGLAETVKRILACNLKLKHDEHYLFFTDTNSRWETDAQIQSRRAYLHAVYDAFLELTQEWPNARYDRYESTRQHGGEPRENIWRLAFGEKIYSWLDDANVLWKLRQGADV